MNIIQKVTLAILRKNKRRTIVTILGTAVAVAMVTALAVLSASYLEMYRQEAILNTGNWHIAFTHVDKRALPLVEETPGIRTAAASRYQGFALLPGRSDKTRQALSFNAYTAQGLAELPLELLEGRLPSAPGEILLSDEYTSITGDSWPLGETRSLETGYYVDHYTNENNDPVELEIWEPSYLVDAEWHTTGPTALTVVGYARMYYLEPGWMDYFTALTLLDLEALPTTDNNLTVLAQANSVTREVYDIGSSIGNKLAELYGEYTGGPSYNSQLLAAGGVLYNDDTFLAIAVFLVILLGIILIGSISLIHNAFSISLAERLRALGMLAGVGATRRQKRQSVFFEAFLIGIFAIPLGILSGLVGIGITLGALGGAIGRVFGVYNAMSMVVPPWVIVFTTIFSALILLVSAWLPARRAAKVTPVEAMRGEGTVQVRRIRGNRLARRLLGFEAELGLKNSKRSRRRYFAILSSLAISVVLFLTVSAAMLYIRLGMGLTQSSSAYNIQIHLNLTDPNITFADFSQRVEELRALPNAGEMDAYYSTTENATLTLGQIPAQTLAYLDEETQNEDGSYNFAVDVYAMDPDTLARYCQSAGITPAAMQGRQRAILLSPINARTPQGGWAAVTPSNLQAGDSLTTFRQVWMEGGQMTDTDSAHQWEIAAVTDIAPGAYNEVGSNASRLVLIVALADYETILQGLQNAGAGNNRYLNIFSTSPDSAALYQAVEEMPADERFYTFTYDMAENRQRTQAALFILQVFTYGFVVLITLVCTANIFNTISTGIALRAREFAMLRSVGLTPKGFNRMMDCETLFYGVKALAYGVPASVLLSFALYRSLINRFTFPFTLPWSAYLLAGVGVFVVVGLSVLYARSKIRKLNIADTLKNENW